MQISVTKDHLKRGIQGDKNNCPVCLALKETFETTDVEVGGEYASVNGNLYSIPRICTDIDNKPFLSIVNPFDFRITPA